MVHVNESGVRVFLCVMRVDLIERELVTYDIIEPIGLPLSVAQWLI